MAFRKTTSAVYVSVQSAAQIRRQLPAKASSLGGGIDPTGTPKARLRQPGLSLTAAVLKFGAGLVAPVFGIPLEQWYERRCAGAWTTPHR